MAHDTRSRPRGGKKSLNLSANQELKKVLNLQIVATHYQASFPYLEGAVGATAGASLLTARACKQSWAWRAAATALRRGPVMLVMKSARKRPVLCELQPRVAAIPDLRFSKTKFEKKRCCDISVSKSKSHSRIANEHRKKSSIKNFATEIEMD